MLAMIIWLQEINVNAKSISTLYGLFKSQSRIEHYQKQSFGWAWVGHDTSVDLSMPWKKYYIADDGASRYLRPQLKFPSVTESGRGITSWSFYQEMFTSGSTD